MGAATQDLRGRTCLVTGSTDGHGKAVALALAARGADVVLHARNREKALAVQAEVARAGGGKTPELLLADFASPAAIDRAVAEYLASGRPLHVLVNNAGLVGLSRRVDEAGHELTFAVNYLAMFRLTLGLLPRLRESAPARIVNVGSDTYKIARLDFDDDLVYWFAGDNSWIFDSSTPPAFVSEGPALEVGEEGEQVAGELDAGHGRASYGPRRDCDRC